MRFLNQTPLTTHSYNFVNQKSQLCRTESNSHCSLMLVVPTHGSYLVLLLSNTPNMIRLNVSFFPLLQESSYPL